MYSRLFCERPANMTSSIFTTQLSLSPAFFRLVPALVIVFKKMGKIKKLQDDVFVITQFCLRHNMTLFKSLSGENMFLQELLRTIESFA